MSATSSRLVFARLGLCSGREKQRSSSIPRGPSYHPDREPGISTVVLPCICHVYPCISVVHKQGS